MPSLRVALVVVAAVVMAANAAPMATGAVAARPVVATRALAATAIAAPTQTAVDLLSHARILLTHKAASHRLSQEVRKHRASARASRAMTLTTINRPATHRLASLHRVSPQAIAITSGVAIAPAVAAVVVVRAAAQAAAAMVLAGQAAPVRSPVDKR